MTGDPSGDLRDRDRLARALWQLRSGARAQRACERLVTELEATRKEAERDRLVHAASLAARSDRPPRPAGMLARGRDRLRDAHIPLRWLATHPLRFVRSVVRLRHQAYRLAVAELAASQLLDAEHYRAAAGVAATTDVVARFVLGGDLAGESPHPLFDPAWYRARAPRLPDHIPPLLHYIRGGGREMRSPHPLFDPAHYVAQWPDGWTSGVTPLTHFLQVGGIAGASPHPLFDSRTYLSRRPDLVSAGINPLMHYLRTAADEMADPHPLFSSRYYLMTQPDVGDTNPLEHFLRHGGVEGRSPHPLFDIAYYWQQRPDLRARAINPLLHYLAFGHREHDRPHPFFDTTYYVRQAGALPRLGINPLLHFLERGWLDGLRPNTWFDPEWYRERNPEVHDMNPLVHFAEHGCRQGRLPSAAWEHPDVRARHPEVAAYIERAERSAYRGGPGRSFARRVPVRLDVSGTVTGRPVAGTARTILCVGHVSPWPVAAGNQYALSRLLHYFQRRGYRIVLVLAPIPEEPLAAGALEHLVREFGNVVICDRSGTVRFSLRDVPDVLTPLGRPGLVETVWTEPGPDLSFCHDAVVAVVRRLVETLGSAAILGQYIFMTRLFPLLGAEALRIVHTHDVFSQKASNVVAYGIADLEISEAEEGRLLRRADLIMAVTPEDAAVLRRIAPSTDVVLNKVDAEVTPGSPWPTRPVVFLPASGNKLNVTGLRDFLRFAWPAVCARVPAAEFRVSGGVGRAVPPGTPGVVALGHVPDLGIEYAGARVVINPAVAGTGLKIKTVEALAHLRPVVGWPHNRDGLAPALLPYVDEVTDWEGFADAVVRHVSRDTPPFDADAAAMVARELSPRESYGELEARIERFFVARAAGGM